MYLHGGSCNTNSTQNPVQGGKSHVKRTWEAGGGGGGLVKRTPNRNEDPLLWVLAYFFPLNTLKGAIKASTVDLMSLNTLRGTKTGVFTCLKDATNTSVVFKWKFSRSLNGTVQPIKVSFLEGKKYKERAQVVLTPFSTLLENSGCMIQWERKDLATLCKFIVARRGRLSFGAKFAAWKLKMWYV